MVCSKVKYTKVLIECGAFDRQAADPQFEIPPNDEDEARKTAEHIGKNPRIQVAYTSMNMKQWTCRSSFLLKQNIVLNLLVDTCDKAWCEFKCHSQSLLPRWIKTRTKPKRRLCDRKERRLLAMPNGSWSWFGAEFVCWVHAITCINMRGARMWFRPQLYFFATLISYFGGTWAALSAHLCYNPWKVWMFVVQHDGYFTFHRHAWPTFWMSSMRSCMDGSKSLDPYPGVTLLFSGQILWIESRGGKWDGHSLAFYFYELMQCNIYYVYFGSTSSQGFKLMTISLASYIYHRFSSYHNSWCLMSVRFCMVGFVVSCRIAWRFVAYATRSSMSLGSSSGHQCNTTLGHVDAPRPCSTHQSEGAEKNSGLNLKQGPSILGISQAIYESECSSSAGGGAGFS